MERLMNMRILVVFAVLWACGIAWAQSVETDPKLAYYIHQNTGYAKAWEDGRNKEVDTQISTQDSILAKTSVLLTIKELSMISLENAKGFGYESGIYKQMFNHCTTIATLSYQLIKTLNDLKVSFIVVMEVGDLVDRAQSLARSFADIVSNGNIKDPMSGDPAKGDGHNYLKRIDRLNMANKIVTELGLVRLRLERMLLHARYLTLDVAHRMIDPQGWANKWNGRGAMEQVIYQWRNFKHR